MIKRSLMGLKVVYNMKLVNSQILYKHEPARIPYQR